MGYKDFLNTPIWEERKRPLGAWLSWEEVLLRDQFPHDASLESQPYLQVRQTKNNDSNVKNGSNINTNINSCCWFDRLGY